MAKRIKTDYPGVFFREARRLGGPGIERVYYIVFKKDGNVLEEKVGRQYKDAMTPARAALIRGERMEGRRPSPKEIREAEKAAKEAEEAKWTIERLWEEYKAQRPKNKALSVDAGRYKKYIEPDFGSKEPKEIVPLDVDRLRIGLVKKQELKPQTVKHVLNLLDAIVNFGVNKGLCEGLSFKIKKPPVHNLKTEDLNPEQLSKLLQAIEKDSNIHARNLIKFVLFTGMRRGELFKLQWSDVDFERGFIRIRDPKGGPDQSIPLNDSARDLLAKHERTESPYVFPGRGGRQRVTIQHAAKRIKERAGLPEDFRPLHGLRHVYASMLASSGKVDMYTLQKLLTHKSPQMTQRYAHLRDDALRRASDLAGDLIEKAIKEEEKKAKANRSENSG